MTARIIGTGSAVPEQIVTNEDLSKIVETSDEWISSRSGIKERRVAKEETTTSLAFFPEYSVSGAGGNRCKTCCGI